MSPTDRMGEEIWVGFQAAPPLLHTVQPILGLSSVVLNWVPGSLQEELMQQEREADHSITSSAGL